MLKVAVLIWIMLGVTLAGSFVTVIVTVPSLYADGMRLIPLVAGAGFLLAMPLAFLVAKRIYTSPRH
ncbi:hypothetical protein HDIA_3356 [Hartmannibacter diazotrophicus]|uniref:CTP synthetase n=1 Tax=Hartmannibacter diazotrophicus TaxID=1482074 RepID=A0A2C9D9C1_9HYPH|nr:hypothetical protein [Hartmannibacter diazotrophicus]SON56897.1 hypothetical protein HDIA_3356 [Hartmannibacter diazotrophicus]